MYYNVEYRLIVDELRIKTLTGVNIAWLTIYIQGFITSQFQNHNFM